MKWKAILVLLAIVLSFIVPPSLPFMADRGALAEIGTLDVCHSATPALSTNGEMPCVNVSALSPLPLAQNQVPEIVNPRLKPFLIASQDERPPKS
jgi:hypothetical protein